MVNLQVFEALIPPLYQFISQFCIFLYNRLSYFLRKFLRQIGVNFELKSAYLREIMNWIA